MSVRADLLVFLASAAWLAGCAAVAPPTGGPRDKTPPRRISSSPDSAARNVSQRYVRMVFSEYIQTKDLQKNLLITPQLPADNPYKLREDRNSVTLLFDKLLEANTTYSFNFREGIVDVTESLPAKNASVSFSTGAVLDSGAVKGGVTNPLLGQPVEDVTVGLYREADTAGVRRAKPYYLTRTDKKGQYQLNFLRTGRYKLYAWTDKNQNGRYDDGEQIAYLPEPITIAGDSVVPTVPLLLTRPDRRPPQATGQQPGPNVLRISVNEGLQRARLQRLPPAADSAAVTEAVSITDKGKTVLIFKTPAVQDGRYLFTAVDSTDNVVRDTLNLRFPVPAAAAKKQAAGALYSVEGSPKSVYRQGQVKFRFSVPVRLAAGQPFGTLIEDSVKRRPLRLPADATLSPDRTLLTVQLNTQARERIELVLDSTAVMAITGQLLGLKPLRLTLTEEAPTGTLSGPIATGEKNFDLQLLNDKQEAVQTLHSPKGRYKFENVVPGTYRLRVLIDRNGDGRWNGGDPNLLVPAEPVYLHPKALQLRANWEVEEKLSF
jgi:uncharacterized protein (DUF2141 family)